MCVCVCVSDRDFPLHNRAKFFRPSINFPTVTPVALVPRWQQVPRTNLTDWVDAGWFPNWLWWGLFWVVAYEKLVPEAKVDAPPSCHSLILGTPHRRRNSPYGTGTHDDDDAAGFFSLFPAPLTEWQHGMGGGWMEASAWWAVITVWWVCDMGANYKFMNPPTDRPLAKYTAKHGVMKVFFLLRSLHTPAIMGGKLLPKQGFYHVVQDWNEFWWWTFGDM